MVEIKAEWARSQQRAKELEIRLHRIQEQNFTGVGAPVLTPQQGQRSYAEAALQGSRVIKSAALPVALRAEELFYIINFSRVEGGEEAADTTIIRKRIKEEV